MNIKVLAQGFLHGRLAALSLTLFAAFARAQEPFAAPMPVDPLAGIPVRVLDRQQVEIGAHKITYKRIAPPVFPAPAPTPTLGPADSASTRTPQRHATSGSSQTEEDPGDAGEKPYKVLFLSATVYDHQFTAPALLQRRQAGVERLREHRFQLFPRGGPNRNRRRGLHDHVWYGG